MTEGKRAIRLVRSRVKDWNLDPQKIGVQDNDNVSINFSDPLAARLKELGVPVLYWRVQGGGHLTFHKPMPGVTGRSNSCHG